MAAKSSTPRKGATRQTKKTTPVKHPIKWWLWLIVVIIVVAFVWGLTQLNQLPATAVSTPDVKSKTPVTSVPPAPTKAKPSQPEQPKDSFEFYQILQDSKVDTSHVDAYQSTPRQQEDFLYMIQAASFRNHSDADRLRVQLILAGLEATIRQTTGDDGRAWYRVTLGPYDSRSKMNRAQDKLVAMNIQSYTYRVKKE
jgi:cell division protein FtsN